MRDIALIAIIVIIAGVLADMYVPFIEFSDVVLVGILVSMLVLVDIIIKVTRAILGGGSGEQ